MELKFYRVQPEAYPPKFATEGAACFDLSASLPDGQEVVNYDQFNLKTRKIAKSKSISILVGHRALIPTNLIFDIPQGYSLRLHARSGLALKNGLILANSEGVVDYDYVDPTFVMLWNTSQEPQTITDGDRIAQGELVPMLSYNISQIQSAPGVKTSREGGFGSTGVQ